MKLSATVIHIDRRRFRGRCCFSLLCYDQLQMAFDMDLKNHSSSSSSAREIVTKAVKIAPVHHLHSAPRSDMFVRSNMKREHALLPPSLLVGYGWLPLNWIGDLLLVTELLFAVVVEFCVILFCSISNFEMFRCKYGKYCCVVCCKRCVPLGAMDSNTLDFRLYTYLIIPAFGGD
jgi:hypothetical protein